MIEAEISLHNYLRLWLKTCAFGERQKQRHVGMWNLEMQPLCMLYPWAANRTDAEPYSQGGWKHHTCLGRRLTSVRKCIHPRWFSAEKVKANEFHSYEQKQSNIINWLISRLTGGGKKKELSILKEKFTQTCIKYLVDDWYS